MHTPIGIGVEWSLAMQNGALNPILHHRVLTAVAPHLRRWRWRGGSAGTRPEMLPHHFNSCLQITAPRPRFRHLRRRRQYAAAIPTSAVKPQLAGALHLLNADVQRLENAQVFLHRFSPQIHRVCRWISFRDCVIPREQRNQRTFRCIDFEFNPKRIDFLRSIDFSAVRRIRFLQIEQQNRKFGRWFQQRNW